MIGCQALWTDDGIPASAYTTYIDRADYSMWLMFTPTNGHKVPLKRIDWNWNGCGVLTNGDWILTSDPRPNPSPMPSESYDYPTWTNNIAKFKPHPL
jgi:hypothetical protein